MTDALSSALEGEAEELRLPGLSCPMPVLRAKKVLAKLASGARLRVWSTDPHSLPDLSDFCRQTGHGLVAQTETEDEGGHWFVTLITRRAA
ncbi:sulfurtransferase TusA family protein [Sutterella sp.]|uniref:sulfurtransferase TusA family protein n=1 Tax=Sutterella sp. TaxID=1981025 RepID=UPI0026E06D8D|nr:sulfurtransferase TusA family protein [Sutterella sp.]MDO5532033.1 sulfurtransferase TusA family protein [Sutterella sp.]